MCAQRRSGELPKGPRVANKLDRAFSRVEKARCSTGQSNQLYDTLTILPVNLVLQIQSRSTAFGILAFVIVGLS